MAWFKKKDKDEVSDLSVITDVKEPFSWSVFWDEKIIGGWKKFKKFLDERGISFFLFSPFQYRSRLVVKLVIIILFSLVGVVPRTASLYKQMVVNNRADAFNAIKDKSFVSGDLTIKPLGSGAKDDVHALVFNISGSTEQGVPSTTDSYVIELTYGAGVVEPEKIKYSYTIVPVNADNRLLVVMIDQTEQNDQSGLFHINVYVKGTERMDYPIEVLLSEHQKETDVYDGDLRLENITNRYLNGYNDANTPIADAIEELDTALKAYRVNEERLASIGVTIDFTSDDMEVWAENSTLLDNITDDSTTKDVDGTLLEVVPVVDPVNGITVDGVNYKINGGDVLAENSVQAEELPLLVNMMGKVKKAVESVNSARTIKYTTLAKLTRALNVTVDSDGYVDGGPVVSTTERMATPNENKE